MNDFILFMQARLGCHIDAPLDALKLARALITTTDEVVNKYRRKIITLTDDLEQCKIELQIVQDSLTDAHHRLKELDN